jgi:acetoacetyl-CoA reductase
MDMQTNLFGLQGKVIFVTGGSRGIGAAIVKQLECLGAVVAHINHNKSEVVAYGRQLFADVRDLDAVRNAVEQIESELGPIYGVVANAGITNDALFPELSPSNWSTVLDVNLNGAYNTIQPVIPKLYERKEGALVFISSIVGERGNVGQANYAASKAGLIGLAKALAKEGARYNVRSNVIAPGFIATEMLQSIPEKVKERILTDIPMRRFGTPEEIASAVSFLLSPTLASYITGDVLRINGGQHT